MISFALLFWSNLFAQQTVYQLEKIEIEGLKRTQRNYLESFLQSRIGDRVVNDSLILEDVQRLKNVASVANAHYELDTLANQLLTLRLVVVEKRTFLPVVNFGGIRDNFWFQVGITDNNWRGRGQQLEVYYQNNDRFHNGQLYYRVPFVNMTPWGYSLSLRKYSAIEPLFFDEGAVNYDYDNYALGGTAIYQFNVQRQAEVGLTLFREVYQQSAEQDLLNPPGPSALTQDKSLGMLRYVHKRLEYDEFYLRRSEWWGWYQTVYNFDDGTFFHSFIAQLRQFWRPRDKVNLALRLRLGLSTNNDSPFAPFVVDSNVNLRGVGNRIDRGTAQAVLNLEYRQTVYDRRDWAGQLVVFTDLGTWRDPGGQLVDLFDTDQFRQFVGGGFRIIYKKIYRATLRADYGIDIFNPEQRGFVLGVGQYF